MRTAFVDVQFRGHARLAQRRIEHHAVLHRHGGVRGGVEQEGGRGLRRHLGFIRQARHQFGIGILAQQIAPRALMRELAEGNHRIAQHQKVRTAAAAAPASKCVPAVEARCPPAEKPMIPMRSGSRRYSAALERTVRMARCAAPSFTGWGYFGPNRYLSTNADTPSEFSHLAIWSPSLSMESPWYPPPGQTITAVPVPRPTGARYGASDGLSISSVPSAAGAPPGHSRSAFGMAGVCANPAPTSKANDRR